MTEEKFPTQPNEKLVVGFEETGTKIVSFKMHKIKFIQ